MKIKDKTWWKLSVFSDDHSLENITTFCSSLLLGIEQNEECWDFYFDIENKGQIMKILSELKITYNFKYTLETVKYDDWHLSWQKNFKPIYYGSDLVVVPDWDKNRYSQKHIVKIKPGMSFGTGHHETTHMMIRTLLNLDLTDKSVLDLGFGSGILSIISKKIGARKVVSIESDENCKADMEFNLDLNSISKDVEVGIEDARCLSKYDYDIILANIEKHIIMDLIPIIKVKNSIAVLSGILYDQKEDVLNKLKEENFNSICSYKKNEWICITAKF